MTRVELGIAAGVGALVVVLLGVLAAALGHSRARRRWVRLDRWARANGWTLAAKPVVDWGARLPGGNKHGVSLALHGRLWDRSTSLGEYSFTEAVTTAGPGGRVVTTTTVHQFVVVVLHLDRPSGYLGVQPQGVLARWGRTLFGPGSAAGDRDFDRDLRVLGDRAAAAYPLSPELLAAHAAGAVPPWVLDGADLMTWYPGRIDLARIPELVGPLHRVAGLLTGAGAAG